VSGQPAIVDAFYGGERAAEALAAVLFGTYNPSGKLPVTMYPQEFMRDNPLPHMSVSTPPGRTHLHYTGTPEFAFGAGLSYSSWRVDVQRAATTLAAGGAATYSVQLTNLGPYSGRQRVLGFARPKRGARAPATAPRQLLWGYRGVELAVGGAATLSFELGASQLAQANEAGERVLHPGEYEVVFSDGSAAEVSAGTLTVTGAPTVVEASAFRRAALQPQQPLVETAAS
jgi:beta-glucosidase